MDGVMATASPAPRRVASTLTLVMFGLLAACNAFFAIDEPRATGGIDGGQGGAPCPDGLTLCGGRCVDTRRDLDHCGGCGQSCGGGDQVRFCLAEGAGRCVTCDPGQVRCGDRCVDILTDPDHCGSCGRSCLGGTCSVGDCGEVPLHRNLTIGRYIQPVADDVVYYANAPQVGEYVGRVAKTGGGCDGADERCRIAVPPQVLSDDGGGAIVFAGFSASATHLYGVAVERGIARMPLDGGPWEAFSRGRLSYSAIATTNAAVFVGATDPDDYLFRLDTAGTGAVAIGKAATASVTVGSILPLPDDTLLVWVTNNTGDRPSLGLHRLPSKGDRECRGDECPFYTAHEVAGVAVTGTDAYFTIPLPERRGQILKQSLSARCGDGSCALPVADLPFTATVMPLLVDDKHLYWVQPGHVTRTYEIRRQPLDQVCFPAPAEGCGEKFLSVGVRQVSRMAQDATAIYAFVVREDLTTDLVKKAK